MPRTKNKPQPAPLKAHRFVTILPDGQVVDHSDVAARKRAGIGLRIESLSRGLTPPALPSPASAERSAS